MTTIVTVLTEGFADWETALLNAVAHGYYNVETRFATPGGTPVTSGGGMRVTPDMALEAIDPAALDALVICGGSIWQTPQAPDLTALVKAVRAKGKIIAAICDGTVAAARTGLLDDVAHTSNGENYLDVTSYGGKRRYRNVPYAVSDDRVITAPATAPVSFMNEILKALGVADDNLAYYVGMHGAEHAKAA
jgi:putative intracellular protease/amidase